MHAFFDVAFYLYPVSLKNFPPGPRPGAEGLIEVNNDYFENFFISLSLIPLIINEENLTKAKKLHINKLNPWYVTGLPDGDGSFFSDSENLKS